MNPHECRIFGSRGGSASSGTAAASASGRRSGSQSSKSLCSKGPCKALCLVMILRARNCSALKFSFHALGHGVRLHLGWRRHSQRRRLPSGLQAAASSSTISGACHLSSETSPWRLSSHRRPISMAPAGARRGRHGVGRSGHIGRDVSAVAGRPERRHARPDDDGGRRPKRTDDTLTNTQYTKNLTSGIQKSGRGAAGSQLASPGMSAAQLIVFLVEDNKTISDNLVAALDEMAHAQVAHIAVGKRRLANGSPPTATGPLPSSICS